MNSLLTIILAVFASSGFWSLILAIYNSRKQKRTPLENMVLALGRDSLLAANKKYKKMGFIPEDDYETYIGLGEAYIGMKGNTLVKKGFEDNRKLPIKEVEDEYDN